MKFLNWAGNYRYEAARVHRPATVEQVQELVSKAKRVKALGTRHSFNDIADTPEDLVSTQKLDRVLEIDKEGLTVTVESGITYGKLCRHLEGEGFAIPNLASLPHISVAGACATSTHGSGNRNGSLATAVSAIELVTADGSVVRLSRQHDSEAFAGSVVGLGALGIVTRLTLDVSPSFAMRQNVFLRLPLQALKDAFDEISASAYSVSLFTDWREPAFNQVWLKQKSDAGEAPASFFGAVPAKGPMHPIATMSPENCTDQMGVPGPWLDRLPHFKLEFTPSSGEELQTEYLLPRRHAFEAISAIAELRDQIAPLIQITEVRTVAADNLWMSPSYEQDSVCIHFTWVQNWEAVQNLLPRIEARLTQFSARPHWGKLFTMEPERVRSLYPRLSAFQGLARRFDPEGKFRNAFLERYVL